RSEEEWREGHVKGARFAPWQTLTAAFPALPKDKNTRIVTYCRSGARALLAARKLQGFGYTRAVAMTGGIADLEAAGMKVEK
ncbi:MAG: rhodanese-like domain-containing protein, partial [Gammaproteobacteria bacterium]